MPSIRETAEDESSIGGDEPFCKHGKLLWSEECDECGNEAWELSDAIAGAQKKKAS